MHFLGTRKLVETLSRSHGGLDVERPDVLPVFLEERDQEVHGQVDVLDQLLISHANVANSDAQAQDLKNMTSLKLFRTTQLKVT